MSYFQPYKPIRKGMPVWVIILLVLVGFMSFLMLLGIATSATHTQSKATPTTTYVAPVAPAVAQVDDNDQRFVKLLAQGGIVPKTDLTSFTDSAVKAAHAVCNERARGLTELQVASSVQQNAGLPPYESGWFVGASESIYCAEYK